METAALSHVSVWLDEMAPQQGAFAHALEWASHLGLPLYAFTAPQQVWGGRLARRFSTAQDMTSANGPDGPASAEKLQAYAAACARQGVPWNGLRWPRSGRSDVAQFLHPDELCVFGQALPPPLKERLLHESLQSPRTSVLVCPASWRPVARVLVVHQHRDADNRFLDTIIRVCRALRTRPVLLSVARSDLEARRRQRFAEAIFASHQMEADFDFIVSYDVGTAVLSVAGWRRCSHVFVERQTTSPWWRWLRGDVLERLLGASDSLTLLALPGTGLAVGPQGQAFANPAAEIALGPG